MILMLQEKNNLSHSKNQHKFENYSKFYSHQWEVSQTPALSDGDMSDLYAQQTKCIKALVTDLRTDLTRQQIYTDSRSEQEK